MSVKVHDVVDCPPDGFDKLLANTPKVLAYQLSLRERIVAASVKENEDVRKFISERIMSLDPGIDEDFTVASLYELDKKKIIKEIAMTRADDFSSQHFTKEKDMGESGAYDVSPKFIPSRSQQGQALACLKRARKAGKQLIKKQKADRNRCRKA